MTDAAGFALWRTGNIEPSQWNGQAKSNCCGFRENGRRETEDSMYRKFIVCFALRDVENWLLIQRNLEIETSFL